MSPGVKNGLKVAGRVAVYAALRIATLGLALLVCRGVLDATKGNEGPITVEGAGWLLVAVIIGIWCWRRMMDLMRLLSPSHGMSTQAVTAAAAMPLGVARMRRPGDPVSPSIQARARHEAGHAVVAEAVGHEVLSATIRADHATGSGGNVATRLVPDDGEEGPVPPSREEVAISLAGHLAQGEAHDYRLVSGSDDYSSAVKTALMVSLSESGTTMESVIADARALAEAALTEHAKAVDEIAAELLRDTTLTGDRIREIIRESAER